jgi:superfamily I DNA/RNA helicase
MPGLLLDASGLPGWQPYDTIVVDEGQDFMAHWWPALDAALAGKPPGHFYVFYDDNQSVYGATRALPENAGLSPFRLSRNLRNTQRIHTVACLHYQGGAVEAVGPRGVEVSWIPAVTPAARARELGRLIRELCGPEHVVPEEIGILVLNEAEIALYADDGRIAGHPVCRLDQLQAGCVAIDTIRRFKGLERQVVVLVAPEELRIEPELAYVALSRPRSRLYVVSGAEAMKFLNPERESP